MCVFKPKTKTTYGKNITNNNIGTETFKIWI